MPIKPAFWHRGLSKQTVSYTRFNRWFWLRVQLGIERPVISTISDWKKLENFGLYTILINKGQDVGGQIQVGELASKLASPLRPAKVLGAVIKIKQNDFVAKILSQPYKASSQQAYKQSNFLNPNRLKELSIMINSTAQQLDDDRKKTILMNPNISNIRPVNAN